jgi:hypothetical protein
MLRQYNHELSVVIQMALAVWTNGGDEPFSKISMGAL